MPSKSASNDLAHERRNLRPVATSTLENHCGPNGPLSRNISQASLQCGVSPHQHPPTLEIDLEMAHRHVQNILLQKAQLALLISQQREDLFAHAVDCPFMCFPFPSSEHHELLRHTSNLSIIQNCLERSYRHTLDRLNTLHTGSLSQPSH